MTVAIGSDHAGFALKEAVRRHLESSEKYDVTDFGCYSEESVDYPSIAQALGQSVAQGKNSVGILVCGSGIGMSIVANKVAGIRAALCYEEELAQMSRRHNDANVLVLAGRYTSEEKAVNIINAFFDTEFEGGRHQRRVDLIHSLTQR